MTTAYWRRLASYGLLALVALLLSRTPTIAQQTLGGILGTITDASGAVVSAVKAELVSDSTGLTRSVTAKSNGEFAFSDLPAGSYTLTFTHDGFETSRYSGVTVQADRTITLNAQLKVGSVASSVEVSATAG